MIMGEEKKIELEEVDGVDTPPRARVTPEFERKRDYLAGFLAEQKPEPEKGGAGRPSLRAAADGGARRSRHRPRQLCRAQRCVGYRGAGPRPA